MISVPIQLVKAAEKVASEGDWTRKDCIELPPPYTGIYVSRTAKSLIVLCSVQNEEERFIVGIPENGEGE
jgi:hypothetical protein